MSLPTPRTENTPGSTGMMTSVAAASDSGNNNYAPASNTDASMGQSETTLTGHNQAHGNMQPFQVVNFIIALEGIFPARSS
jgi:microcystin-dependent protein